MERSLSQVRIAPFTLKDGTELLNIWGAGDLLFAFYNGTRVDPEPGSPGAGFYIVTAIVPPLLVSHALVFVVLMRTSQGL